jgi:hypothetical protein
MSLKAIFRILGSDETAAAFRSALGNADKTARGIQTAFKTAFAGISVAAIAGVAMRSIELGDTLQKMSVKAGIGGKAISELAYAAKMADVDMAGLANAIRFMQKAVSEAGTGLETPKRAFAAIGVELGEIRGLRADKQFELIAQRISELKDPTDRSRAATELFGRAGADLLPMFEQGAAGIRMAREEAERMGQSFSDEQISKLADADAAIKRLKFSWEAFATSLTAKVAPAISATLDLLRGQSPGVDPDPIRRRMDQLRIEIRDYESFDPMNVREGLRDSATARVQGQLEAARAELRRLRSLVAPGRGSRGVAGAGPEGFAAAEAAEEARKQSEAAAKKAAEEQARIRREFAEYERKEYLRVQESMNADLEDALRETNAQIEDNFDWTLDNITTEVAYSMREVKDELTVFAEQAARNMQTAFADFLFSPFENGLKGMLKGFIDVIRRMVAEVAAAKIFGAMGGVEGVGNFISGLIPGFATGGSFKVGGSGGTDSQLVAFKATPGEMVDIRTPGQARGGASVTINNHIDARGATTDFVRALPGILAQNNAKVQQDLIQWFNRRGYVR